MLVELEVFEIVELIKSKGYGTDKARIIADYVDDCCWNGIKLNRWLSNTEFRIYTDGENKEEVIKMVEEEGYEDYNIYESDGSYFVELI